MKQVFKWIGIGVAALFTLAVVGAMLGGGAEAGAADATTTSTSTSTTDSVATETTTPQPSTTTAPAPTTTISPSPPTTSKSVAAPSKQLTRSEENAIRSAESYLDFKAFSRSGLIDQLEFEGYSTADATFAVDHLNVDWNEQAWKSAEEYLDFMPFSRSGLIDQLVFEGFTKEQATYGVDKAGL